jgi:hypothetical protein
VSVPIRSRLLTEAVSGGRSFVDIGGLWGVVNEQVTVAAAGGAHPLAMVDAAPTDDADWLWTAFAERCDEHGLDDVRTISADLHDPGFAETVGVYDVVHCSGVLYHSPHPLFVVQQLRAVTRRTLLLGTATLPDEVTTAAGRLTVAPGSALFVPALSASHRAILGEWLTEVGANEAMGVNYPLRTAWEPTDCSAWWWFFTCEFVESLLSLSGFRVETVASYWEGRATLFLASVRP